MFALITSCFFVGLVCCFITKPWGFGVIRLVLCIGLGDFLSLDLMGLVGFAVFVAYWLDCVVYVVCLLLVFVGD